LVEAVSFLGKKLEEIDILSVGTTSVPFSVAAKHRSGIVGWNAGLVEILMNA
jgi:hypothetical protein